MEGGNNNSSDMNNESRRNDQTNHIPSNDPLTIPSGSSNNRPHTDQNRAFEFSLSQHVISVGDNRERSEADERRISSIIRRAFGLSSSIGESTNSAAETLGLIPIDQDHNSNDNDGDDDDDDSDVDEEFGQVVLGLAAPTQQERAERARQIASENDLVQRYTTDQAAQANALWHHRVASSPQPLGRIIFPDESAEGAFHPVAPPPSQLPIPHPFIPQFSEPDSNNTVDTNSVPASSTYVLNGNGDFVRQTDSWQVIVETDQTVVFGITTGDGDDDREEMRLNVEGMTYEELVALGERIGSTSTGVTDDAIRENLQHDKYGSPSFASTSRNDSCCICQEDYVNGEDVSTLHCGHSYHTDCIKRWLAIKNKCPICKRPALSP